MKFSRPMALGFALAAALVAVSCSERATPTAPAAPKVSEDLLSGLTGTLSSTVNSLLLKCNPMPEYTASQVIGPSGGTMHIGPHTFTVPAGALMGNVLISADAPHDNLNRVIFQPQGLHFAKSASLTMSYANCQGLGTLLPKHIAYTTDLLQIINLIPSLDDLLSNKVTGQVDHFSEYIVAW